MPYLNVVIVQLNSLILNGLITTISSEGAQMSSENFSLMEQVNISVAFAFQIIRKQDLLYRIVTQLWIIPAQLREQSAL